MSSRKRRRRKPKDESESEYEFSTNEDESEDLYDEPSPPPQKRRRRSNRIKKRKESEHESEESEDEYEESAEDEVRNDTNNKIPKKWQTKMNKLEKENALLKEKNKKLQQEVKALKKAVPSKPEINGKKYFNGFQKSLIRIAKLKKTRFYGCSSTICVEQTLDKDDFELLFEGKGRKTQPLPNYKPKSVKTVIEFGDWEEVKKLFAHYSVELKREITVSRWYQGGWRMGKSEFMRKGTADVSSLTVEYNKSTRILKLNFDADLQESIEDHGFMSGWRAILI